MEREKVYLLFTDTGTIFTKMIKLYTKKPYNHASIAFDSNFEEVYSFGRKQPRNPVNGGFVQEDLQRGVFKNARCAIYSCNVEDEQIQKMKSFINEIEKEKHLYRYNLLGLLGVIVNKPLPRKYAYFCSQFVANVLNAGEIVTFQKSLCLISPQDLQNMESFELVFEGRLTDLFFKQQAIEIDYPLIVS